jgi:Tol biopolymer transport system component
MHAHFPVWSPDQTFIYFVMGTLPSNLDVWRIAQQGGTPERVTAHQSRVTHPVFLDRRTLLYLAGDAEGSGPWLYSMDVDRRRPHRLTGGLDRYVSLAGSGGGKRLAAVRATPKSTLWRLRMKASAPELPVRIPLSSGSGAAPRLGADYLLYVSTSGANQSIWKVAQGTGTELWSSDGGQILGGPAIAPGGQSIAFTVQRQGRTYLYTIQSDGTGARVVSDALTLRSAPAWSPDGRSLTAAAEEQGVPNLFTVPVGGGTPTRLTREFSLDPAWSPEGNFVVYSGSDVGTTFPLRGVTIEGTVQRLPELTLGRGSRRLVFRGRGMLVFLKGGIQHKDLWLQDLETGEERKWAELPPDFDVRDFDVSPDGQEIVLERAQELSQVVLIDLTRP